MFFLICTWINRWLNNRKAGDLRRYRAHYDVVVMMLMYYAHGLVALVDPISLIIIFGSMFSIQAYSTGLLDWPTKQPWNIWVTQSGTNHAKTQQNANVCNVGFNLYVFLRYPSFEFCSPSKYLIVPSCSTTLLSLHLLYCSVMTVHCDANLIPRCYINTLHQSVMFVWRVFFYLTDAIRNTRDTHWEMDIIVSVMIEISIFVYVQHEQAICSESG